MSDIVRINGRAYTRSRAIALGLISEAGTTAKEFVVVPPAKPTKLGRPKGSVNKVRTPGPILSQTDPVDDIIASIPVLPPIRPTKKIKPLVPQNVDAGVPITDPDTLAEIVARTNEIEAARLAKLASADGTASGE
jgi:hypothetical protein